MTVLIIAAAYEDDISYIKSIYEEKKPQWVICADGGILKAESLKIPVKYHMGDFDSSMERKECEKIKYSGEKDWSDTESALYKALELGADKVILTGALGGRADHCISNLCALLNPDFKDMEILICDSQNIISAVRSSRVSMPKGFKYMGIVPIDDKLEGVTLRGVKYPLEGATLYRYESLGISNEILSEKADIIIENGRGLLIFSKDR